MNVEQIMKEYKTKLFTFNLNNYKNNTDLNIKSFDDMYDILYLKNKYYNKDLTQKINSNILTSLNYTENKSGNIIKDIFNFVNRYRNLNNLLHDNSWIKSTYNDNQNNYFEADINQTLIYNSTDKSSINYKEFKEFIYTLNSHLLTLGKFYNFDTKIDLFEDEKYDMIWIIMSVKKCEV
jgi:hypothetical protein